MFITVHPAMITVLVFLRGKIYNNATLQLCKLHSILSCLTELDGRFLRVSNTMKDSKIINDNNKKCLKTDKYCVLLMCKLVKIGKTKPC